ncbi:hypothetical protein D3C75_699430 [compost metagenome]
MKRKSRRIELIPSRRRVYHSLRQSRSPLYQAGSLAAVDNKPAVLRPLDRLQTGFPAKGAVAPLQGPSGQMHHPPFPVLGFHKLAVARPLDNGRRISLGVHGVGRTGFIRPQQLPRAGHCNTVAIFCPAFGKNQIIPAVLPQEMRTFRRSTAGSVPQLHRFSGRGHAVGGERKQPGAAPAIHHVAAAVLIHKVGGVDPLMVQHGRSGIRTLRPLRPDDDIGPACSGQAEGSHQVEHPVHIGDVRGPDPEGVGQPPKRQILAAGEAMSDIMPVHQIPGMGQHNSGEKLESGISQIIILAHPHNGRIRMEAGQDGIGIGSFIHSFIQRKNLPLSKADAADKHGHNQRYRVYLSVYSVTGKYSNQSKSAALPLS